MRKQREKSERLLCWCLFIVYLVGLAYFLFFAESTGRTELGRTYQYNLLPLHEIRRFFRYRKQLGMSAVILNLLGNVMAFIPFGLFLPLLMRRLRSAGLIILLGFEFSLSVETLQLVSKVGSFDVDDILLNTMGVIIGYILCWILILIRRSYLRRRKDG